MFAQKLFSNRRFLQVLPLAAILLLLAGGAPVTAENGASETNTQAMVSVSNLNIVCTPPSPVNPTIQLTGDFVIQAHIVLPPSPILPPRPVIPAGTIVTLHIDATGISGVGLTDGTVYRGSQGTSQNFVQASDTMVFNTAFDLVPSQTNQTPPSPICPVQAAFQVQLHVTEIGFATISASLNPPG